MNILNNPKDNWQCNIMSVADHYRRINSPYRNAVVGIHTQTTNMLYIRHGFIFTKQLANLALQSAFGFR